MTRPIAFLFGGQGSQYHGMGRPLFDHEPVFRDSMRELDEVVQKLAGVTVVGQVYGADRGVGDPFDRLLFTHPAIVMVEYSLARLLRSRGVEPDYVGGSSLGEFAAAAVAGVLPIEDVLSTVVRQAQLCERSGPPGRMLAVLSDVASFEHDPVFAGTELASVNYPEHFVVSGTVARITELRAELTGRGTPTEVLPVPHAFHSSHIDLLAEGHRDLFRGLRPAAPRIPLVSGVDGSRPERLDADYFWNVVRRPIDFPAAVRTLAAAGDPVHLDLSPGGTLATFLRRNRADAECHPLLTPFMQDRERLADATAAAVAQRRRARPTTHGEGTMTVFLFPGQGSQFKGMGAGLFEEFPDLTATADRVLGYSIRELCVEDPRRELGDTRFTQPALYVVNALSHLKRVADTGVRPDFVAGHSLGEYSALFAAGAVDFETGLRLVKRRGELMSEAEDGGMAAVIGLTVEEVRDLLRREGLTAIDVANHNSPHQVVVAGPKADIPAAREAFVKGGAQHYVPLSVSGAFHSRLMAGTRERFAPLLREAVFRTPEIPVLSNVSGRPHREGGIADGLAEQITHVVEWNDTIRYLLGRGEVDFVEVGPGTVLTKLVRKIRDEAGPQATAEPVAPAPAVAAAAAPAASAPATAVPAVVAPGAAASAVTAPAAAVTAAPAPEAVRSAKPSGQAEPELPLWPMAVTARSLGDPDFRRDYGLTHAYLAGAMYRGIASVDLVVRMGRAGMLGFFGTAMVRPEGIEDAIRRIQRELPGGEPYGMNLIHSPAHPEAEEAAVDLYLRYGVRVVEASAYMGITPALVRYRAKGLRRGPDGRVTGANRIIAKLSRPEVARVFLAPAPEDLVARMVAAGVLTRQEAELLREVPMADDLCVEADSGGHTDRGVLVALLPAIIALRDELAGTYGYSQRIRVGAAGGIGNPAAAAAAFVLGAAFVLTGSVNQCTVEAGTSDAVKDMLQNAGVQDTAYAPAGDMFEIGAQVQVLQRGTFFPGRSNRLYQLYKHFESLDAIDDKTLRMIQDKYFHRDFDQVWKEVRAHQPATEIQKAERNPKYRMALVFKWYFAHSTRAALEGDPEHRVDYQIHCGPALGTFNQWVKGTDLESWRNRHADEIGLRLMAATAELVNGRFADLFGRRDESGSDRLAPQDREPAVR
ncbi:ACP S-malonyltransferase [Streptomyces sp. NPDC015220]|uniref:ACP S-malonyltransferase n=1 Tax=Streptomyces sp. NPDC015220 TaxID=3364947 RepID=UPI0037016352